MLQRKTLLGWLATTEQSSFYDVAVAKLLRAHVAAAAAAAVMLHLFFAIKGKGR